MPARLTCRSLPTAAFAAGEVFPHDVPPTARDEVALGRSRGRDPPRRATRRLGDRAGLLVARRLGVRILARVAGAAVPSPVLAHVHLDRLALDLQATRLVGGGGIAALALA